MVKRGKIIANRIRIASWNVNSIRSRVALIKKFTETYQPDVLCLQEIKVANDLFPYLAVRELGFPHVAVNGQKNYHGVAILSRFPLERVGARYWCGNKEARHNCATMLDGIELHNFYVPAGGDIPDPAGNIKFAQKLQFLSEMGTWFDSQKATKNKFILVGDLNVAPLETDVWSHQNLLNVVSHTPIEVEHLMKVRASHDWVDAVRHFIPTTEHIYSWWSYRARDWAASNRGRRLDHIWVTPRLKSALKSAAILREMRGWERPSDHVPVIADLSL